MPDDASPQFRTSQSDHASNLREERKLMRVAGISRSAARAALAGYAKERMEAESVRALQGIPAQQREPSVTVSETSMFRAQPLTLGDIPGQGGGGGGPETPTVPAVLNKRARFLAENSGVVSVETIDFTGETV